MGALSARDWDSLKTYLSDDCIYLDVPVGRPRGAWSRRHRQADQDSLRCVGILRDSRVVPPTAPTSCTSHHEEWHWPTGESAVNKFVTGAPRRERQDYPVEGLLGYGRAGQLRARRPGRMI